MIDGLEKGILDIIITPQIVTNPLITFEAFFKETIILIGGKDMDRQAFDHLLKTADYPTIETWLQQQKWYGTTGDMEHLRKFWQLNFNKYPDFRPNYIVPNINSIVRCLSSGKGLAIVPDFLCKNEIENGSVQLLWKGHKPLVNKLYFATRKKNSHLKKSL
ncbi:hypothetical protein BXU11_16650 [Flavobacterium sp. LM5]|uniref:LysR substrate-binding domain-containing protein n=1 Tax=Flavobacterium sp. LM5 TaxID=1938610 RepID=UPI0009C425A7|nr:LysR substrate-binding domain-containing protein [Flavobacterium sp. LM5]OOV21722.1 hypothetical protein BXU11_16650 [Flavobacterium sp. LM5]